MRLMVRIYSRYFCLSGLCKHHHVAKAVAASLRLNIEDLMEAEAISIHENGNFIYENDELTVITEEGLENVAHGRCTCIAASHGLTCICMLVLQILSPECKNISLPTPIQHQPAPKPNHEQIAKELSSLISYEIHKIKECPNAKEICGHLKSGHGLLNRNKKFGRKRKIALNSEVRKAIIERKKKKIFKGSKKAREKKNVQTLNDGSFKMTKSSRRTKRKNVFKDL